MEELLRGKVEGDDDNAATELENQEVPKISLNTMEGQYHPSTLCMQGTCQDQHLMILIDGGSTHKFIKASTTSKLSLPLVHILTFDVYVGSGDSIECNAKCVGLPLQIQDHQFKVDTYVFNLRGADIMLGVQWIMGLGTIRTNYKNLTKRLLKNGGVNNRVLQKMVANAW